MKLHESLLFVLTLTWRLSALVDGAGGKGIGEPCDRFDQCGDYPKSFMRCLRGFCQCADSQYYESEMNMCVSKVGHKCDAEAPQDAIKLEIKCGENAFCSPLSHERFGRCRCAAGFRETSAGKCVPMASRWNSPTHLPSHPKHGGGGGSSSSGNGGSSNKIEQEERGTRPDLDNRIVSFPYSSANTKSQSFSIHNTRFTILLSSAAFTLWIPAYLLKTYY